MNDPNFNSDEDTPHSTTEVRLGRFIADALEHRRQNTLVVVEDLLADRPDLFERGRELIQNLDVLHRAARPDGPTIPQPFPKDFLVLRPLGEGAFGRVWLAEDLHLPRQVALKTLRAPVDSDAGETALAAMRGEAAFLVELSHPNLVRVYAWRQFADDHFLIMEYVDGGSLESIVQLEPLPWDRASRYIADVAEGLLAAHKKGIIHRDIKPANILLDLESDDAKLTDFGVASRLGTEGTIIGTKVYMPPEAFRGQISEASDVYGLAATLFRLVAGEVPFRGVDSDEQVKLIEQGLPNLDPRFVGMPESLERVIRDGLAADPGVRPKLLEFLNRLRAGLNQSLADELAACAPTGAELRLKVSREVNEGRWETLAATHPTVGRLQRDMRRVPKEPNQVCVQTGDRVQIEVTTDRDGFISLFNIGPTGNLNVLYPEYPMVVSPPNVQAGHPLLISDVVFEPPAGRERLFAIWSKEPLPLTPKHLRMLIDAEESDRSMANYASRDMHQMKEAVVANGPANSHVEILELIHEATS